jgi:hypothetical protein
VLEIMQAYFPKEEGSAAAAARDRLRERFLSPMCLIYLHASAFICDLYSCRFVSIRGHFLRFFAAIPICLSLRSLRSLAAIPNLRALCVFVVKFSFLGGRTVDVRPLVGR